MKSEPYFSRSEIFFQLQILFGDIGKGPDPEVIPEFYSYTYKALRL